MTIANGELEIHLPDLFGVNVIEFSRKDRRKWRITSLKTSCIGALNSPRMNQDENANWLDRHIWPDSILTVDCGI
jgi:hypothetical protein